MRSTNGTIRPSRRGHGCLQTKAVNLESVRPLDCARCDRRELPEGYESYRRTPDFTEESIPAAILNRHATRRGVWGLIRISRGQLEYHIHSPFNTTEILTPAQPGVVLPEVEHHVTCPRFSRILY